MHPDLLLASLCSACLVEIHETQDGGLTLLVTCHQVHACHYCSASLRALTYRAGLTLPANPDDDDPSPPAPLLTQRR